MFPRKASSSMTIREFINRLYQQKNFVKSEDTVSQAVHLGSYVLDGDGFGAVYNFQEENLIIIEDGDTPSDIKQTVHSGISYHTIQMIAGEIRLRHYDNGNGISQECLFMELKSLVQNTSFWTVIDSCLMMPIYSDQNSPANRGFRYPDISWVW